MRWIRKGFDVGMPVAGMFLVFLAALGVQDLQIRIVLILIGLLLIQVGVWKLANPLYPNERRYHDLRLEVDRFISMVREINQAALQARVLDTAEAWDRYRSVVDSMHRSVDRMGELAGQEHSFLEDDPEDRPYQSAGFLGGAGL